MIHRKHLLIGSIIAKKYEVVDILGEDDFEILYLVRDMYRKGSFFVLKELFLETFSSRREERVYTLPEAMGVFTKRKEQIIEELDNQKPAFKADEIKVYGYEEDNETIYTIMEFSNNAPLEKYLQFTDKNGKSLPTLSELINQEQKSKKSFALLKILLLLGILSLIAFFAYHFFQKYSTEKKVDVLEMEASISPQKLRDRNRSDYIEESEAVSREKVTMEKVIIEEPIIKKKIIRISDENLTKLLTPVKDLNVSTNDSNHTKILETNASIINEVLSKEKIEENLTEVITPPIINTDSNISSTQSRMKNFLDAYIHSSSSAKVDDILVYYDRDIKKYFKLRNVTHKSISKELVNYNKKWSNRKFSIVDFKIIRTYKVDDVNYYNITTLTKWKVSNKRDMKRSGTSKGFMTLKEANKGFKITSIYTIK